MRPRPSSPHRTAAPGGGAGAAAEDLAARFLERRGLTVLRRNYRCRGGEIDLVCSHGGTLVFVEVRLRSSERFGGADQSITAAKRRRIVLAAEHYLLGRPEQRCRFDAVLLSALEPAAIRWIPDAFDAH
ncbi:MAG TPA: YraN family protein [Rhodocyclaceae bacterium]|nr:MAG: YraN family protein [Rhodocyclales bacterium CG_4_10_14_3_um_filter_68_10]HCX33585.1 YraN family protein [Rhodocyclaceae bacterium]